MSKNGSDAGRFLPLTLIDRGAAKTNGTRQHGTGTRHEETPPDLVRDERALQNVATELAVALEHLERGLLVSKGTGLTGRVQEAFDAVDALQREAAREFGRKVGDRLGRESLWRVQKGVDAP